MEITLTRFGICDENNKIKEIIHVRSQSMKGTITFAYKYVSPNMLKNIIGIMKKCRL